MSNYPYADKLAKIKTTFVELGIEPKYYKQYSGILTKEYLDKRLPAIFAALLEMIDRGVYPSMVLVSVQDIAILDFIANRDISSVASKMISDFEKPYGLQLKSHDNQCFLDTDKRFVDFKNICETLNKIVRPETV